MEKEIHFALTAELYAETLEILSPDTGFDYPERGLIGVVSKSTGSIRNTYLLKEIIPPTKEDVKFVQGDGLLFDRRYKSRAIDKACEEKGMGLIFIHTHPISGESHFPGPSGKDLRSDSVDLFHIGQALPEGAPLLAGIMGDNENWSIRSYNFSFPTTPKQAKKRGFKPNDGTFEYATAIRIVGKRLIKRPTNKDAEGPAGALGTINHKETDSSIKLWGADRQKILSGLRVGITGLGGVGGILSEHVPRIGIGEVALIDYDIIKDRNLNRAQGANKSDVANQTTKLDVAIRNAVNSATAPDFKYHPHYGSIVEVDSIPHLLNCDIILNGADTDWSRQVLDHIAHAHLIPVIDGGTLLKTNKTLNRLLIGQSDINTTGPGFPCFECAGIYTKAGVTEEQEEPHLRGDRGYIDNGSDQDTIENNPSVLPNNTLVAGLMELRLQNIILGTSPEVLTGTQRYNMLYGDIRWKELMCNGSCPQKSLTALGDLHQLPTGTDLNFQKVRQEQNNSNLQINEKSWWQGTMESLKNLFLS